VQKSRGAGIAGNSGSLGTARKKVVKEVKAQKTQEA
jgi:hypothetical protein